MRRGHTSIQWGPEAHSGGSWGAGPPQRLRWQDLLSVRRKQTLEKASKADGLAKSERLRDDTRAQLDADEDFFADASLASPDCPPPLDQAWQ